MTISKRHASTIFDRANLTLVDIKDLSEPISVLYEPEELFTIYHNVLAVNLSLPDWDQSTSFSLLLTVITFLQSVPDPQIQSLGALRQIRLQEFLATPIIIFNDVWLGSMVSDSDMGKAVALAVPSYRVSFLVYWKADEIS